MRSILSTRTMTMLLTAVLCLGAVSGALADYCYQDVTIDCSPASASLSLPSCNAVYGAYDRHGALATELQGYANLHIDRSYDYLLSAAFYNGYSTNRAGFSKLFRKLSDDAWEKAIGIIKHVTMRGDQMNFALRPSQALGNYTVELHELGAMAKALDSQKELAEQAFRIHREATRNSPRMHDPEIAHYMKEEFMENQAKMIRELAGHSATLRTFTERNGQDISVSFYLFDEYLQKIL